MRIYYFLSNKEIDLNAFGFEVKKFDSKEYMILFTQDMLNVIGQNTYDLEINKKYCYALKIDSDKNIIKNISILFNKIISLADDLELVFDSGNKRYINKKELMYYSKNIIYIGKLFNVEISSYSEYKTEYKTIGLNTLGLDEIKMYLPKEHDNDVYNKFKYFVCNYVLSHNLDLFAYYEECLVIDYEELLNYNLSVNDFILKQEEKHLVDNYKLFVECFGFKNKEDKFFINENQINEISDVDVKSYLIKTDVMEYNHINIFYYYKNK